MKRLSARSCLVIKMEDNGSGSGLSNSTEPIGIIEDFTFSLASLSIIACIISLVVLIYFKLYRSFIYRLMLYSFISLIILSSSTIVLTIEFFYQQLSQGNGTLSVDDIIVDVIPSLFVGVSLLATFVLATTISLSICVLVLCNHQFTYRADIVMPILIILGYFVIGGVYAAICYLAHSCEIPIIIFYTILILVNVFLTVLTLVPLCGRACGCNMCVRKIRTKESYRKALKEVLPLMILPLPSFVPYLIVVIGIILHIISNLFLKIALLASGALGLIAALAFALHLCFIGKTKLCKQRGRKTTPQADYGTVNLPHTRHTTVYVEGEGIMSETCVTEHPYVSEGEEDTRYLLQKNNQQ